MTIDEVIAELTEIKERNTEATCDGGSLEVRIQSEEGTFDSTILSIDMANDVWLIVKEPDYDPV